MKLILASASPRRAFLLQQVGIPFEVITAAVDEEVVALPPNEMVVHLALAKAEQIAARLNSGLVLGADTVVVDGNEILGKPGSKAEAVRMLKRLSGRSHTVITGLALVDAAGGCRETACAETRVWMRDLEPELISAYVETEEPLDKAGAYGIQGKAALFIERIEGCYSNVVGLPLGQLYFLLTRMEIKPWSSWREKICEHGQEPDD